jgi:hypothetical protein
LIIFDVQENPESETPKGNPPPDFASVSVKGDATTEEEDGMFARKGELDVRDVSNDFDRVPFLKFTGLNQHPDKPLVIKRVSRSGCPRTHHL